MRGWSIVCSVVFPWKRLTPSFPAGRRARTPCGAFCRAHGLPLFVVPADWKTHGKKAGPLRNTDIVARADALVAFWDGVSRGTRDAIVKARLAGKLVEVFPCARSAGTLIADEADSSTPSKEAKDQS